MTFPFDNLFLQPQVSKLRRSDATFLAFVNGRFDDALSTISDANISFTKTDGGLVLRVAENAKIQRPLQIMHFYPATASEKVASKITVVVASHGELALDEIHFTPAQNANGENVTTEIELEAGAAIKHNRIQLDSEKSESLVNTIVNQQSDSHYEALDFSFGAGKSRHNLNVRLVGENAQATLSGLYAIPAKHSIEHNLVVEHIAPRTQSHQLYKGVIKELGKSAFHGKIHIFKNAQQVSASQLNKNLLLGKKAQARTKPELEILADDVKCSHGATVGQISEEELFYLQTRAIPREDAVKMLVRGFAGDVLNRIADETLKKNLAGILAEEFFNP